MKSHFGWMVNTYANFSKLVSISYHKASLSSKYNHRSVREEIVVGLKDLQIHNKLFISSNLIVTEMSIMIV